MRFESIDIVNYRQYQNLHLEFPKHGHYDLHVILGSNGVGKSNFLNAINWCLYGDEPHLTDEKRALSICNLSSLEDARKQNVPACTVGVTIKASEASEGKFLEIHRTCVVKVNENVDASHLYVKIISTDSVTQDYTNDEAMDIINQYIPQNIREYFFFDGEQLYNYFGVNRIAAHVKDSIFNIAQITAVIHARQHLETIVTDYRREVARYNPHLDKIQKELDETHEKITSIQSDIDELKSTNAVSQQRVAELKRKISGSEKVAEVKHKFDENAKLLEGAQKEYNALMSSLYNLFHKYYVAIMLYDVNRKAAQYIDTKDENGQLMPDINIDVLRHSVEECRCCLCHRVLPQRMLKEWQKIIDMFDMSPEVSRKLVEIKNDVHRLSDFVSEYMSSKSEILTKLQDVERKISDLTAENELLQMRLDECSIVDNIVDWVTECQMHEQMIPDNLIKIDRYEQQIVALKKHIDELNCRRASEMRSMSKVEDLRDKMAMASYACRILMDVEKSIIDELKSCMESETFTFFNQLIWKKNTYKRIVMDDDFNVDLIHQDTNESCIGSISAAECEMLALAFTLALHKISGHKNPLCIDTPVGRVSDDNRENFAEGLLTVSEHKQLILVFTPSEFSEEIRKYFTPKTVANMYMMRTNHEKSTIVERVGVKNG